MAVLLYHWEGSYPGLSLALKSVPFLGTEWDLLFPVRFGWIGVNLLGNATINAGTDNGGVLEGRLEGFGIDGRGVYGGSQDTSSCDAFGPSTP